MKNKIGQTFIIIALLLTGLTAGSADGQLVAPIQISSNIEVVRINLAEWRASHTIQLKEELLKFEDESARYVFIESLNPSLAFKFKNQTFMIAGMGIVADSSDIQDFHWSNLAQLSIIPLVRGQNGLMTVRLTDRDRAEAIAVTSLVLSGIGGAENQWNQGFLRSVSLDESSGLIVFSFINENGHFCNVLNLSTSPPTLTKFPLTTTCK